MKLNAGGKVFILLSLNLLLIIGFIMGLFGDSIGTFGTLVGVIFWIGVGLWAGSHIYGIYMNLHHAEEVKYTKGSDDDPHQNNEVTVID